MPMVWTAALAVGVEDIDSEHRELFEHLNTLLGAMSQGRGQAEVARTLAFLGSYVCHHFSTEQKLMARHSYPGAAVHKQQHAEFNRNFREVKTDYETRGTSPVLVLKVQQSVFDWWTPHIRGHDVELGKFLKARQAAPRARALP
jgi:hemerythrin